MQTTTQYFPGRGYTVRDAKGRIVAHSLTPSQLANFKPSATSNQLLDVLKTA